MTGLHKYLLLFTAALLLGAALVVWFYPSNTNFSVDNSEWNGTRRLVEKYQIRALDSLSRLPAEPEETALLLVPYLVFTDGELDKLERYLNNGGTLIIADDYGHGNEVLAYLDVKARFTGVNLVDPLSSQNSPLFPVITHFNDHVFTEGVERLVMNHPAGLSNIGEDEALAYSSLFSFLDMEGNGVKDEEDGAGPLPVMAKIQRGQGRLVLISDPSIFINSMLETGGNQTLLENFSALAVRGMYIDQSHIAESNLEQAKGILKKARSLLGSSAGLLLLVAVFAALLPLYLRGQQLEQERRKFD